jgi:plastocyanin
MSYSKKQMSSRGFAIFTFVFAALLTTVIPAETRAEDGAAAVRQFDLVIRNRELQQDEKTLRVTQGDNVELTWTSDEAGKLHLHGYDIEFEVSPGEPSTVTFQAHATGRFPITSHGFSGEHQHGHEAVLYLEVYPD